MTKIELLDSLTKAAKDFISNDVPPSSRIDAACFLSKYINFFAANQCVDFNLRISNLVCKKCLNTGINHSVQCKPNKKHPTGWKSEKCDCRNLEDYRGKS